VYGDGDGQNFDSAWGDFNVLRKEGQVKIKPGKPPFY
jgi:hypothetical protein